MRGARIRYQQTWDFHFLTFSCYRRRPTLSTVAAMELFEDALERVRLRYLFAAAGYVVMPEHVHLLVNGPQRWIFALAAIADGAARYLPGPASTLVDSTTRCLFPLAHFSASRSR